MTDEQRKSVAIEYLKAFDNGGVTSSGGSILDLFATDAQVYFPKWGVATGRDQIGKLFGDVGATLKSIAHHFSRIQLGVLGQRPGGVRRHQPRRAPATAPGAPACPSGAAGRWCDVFEIRDWQIQRCFIYLDPDYAGKDTARYPWLNQK